MPNLMQPPILEFPVSRDWRKEAGVERIERTEAQAAGGRGRVPIATPSPQPVHGDCQCHARDIPAH